MCFYVNYVKDWKVGGRVLEKLFNEIRGIEVFDGRVAFVILGVMEFHIDLTEFNALLREDAIAHEFFQKEILIPFSIDGQEMNEFGANFILQKRMQCHNFGFSLSISMSGAQHQIDLTILHSCNGILIVYSHVPPPKMP